MSTPEEERKRRREARQRHRARQRGEDVPLRKVGGWPKGTPRKGAEDLTYTGQHYRVYAARGAPAECVFGCVPDRPYKKGFYAWANLTGDYGDPRDYAAMCVRCHVRFDDAVRSMEFPGRPMRLTKLTADDVREIRALAASGMTQAETARRFGIDRHTVSKIVNRKRWRHIK